MKQLLLLFLLLSLALPFRVDGQSSCYQVVRTECPAETIEYCNYDMSQCVNLSTPLSLFDEPENGGNSDGKINGRDAIYSSLCLWRDSNHNGVSEASEISRLISAGIASFELTYFESRRRDRHGNIFRYRAKVRDTLGNHVGRWAWDIFLLR